MSINRRAVTPHSLFHPRAGGVPTAEDRSTFERVALNESQPLTRWMEIGSGQGSVQKDDHSQCKNANNCG